jgi:glutathione S-transferase
MLRLVIGNKNYSSWSLRSWLLLVEAGIEFEEIRLPLSTPEFAARISTYSPSGRVPVLLDGPVTVWDTLAITEYVAERFDRTLWPMDAVDRARARSMCAEMHSGFSALRGQWPMNVRASLPGLGWNLAVERDVDRLVRMWREALSMSGGPFLFGRFGAVDAYFAPVAARFRTYAAALPDDIGAYRDAILDTAGMRAWTEAACQESEFVAEDEPYRRPPGT